MCVCVRETERGGWEGEREGRERGRGERERGGERGKRERGRGERERGGERGERERERERVLMMVVSDGDGGLMHGLIFFHLSCVEITLEALFSISSCCAHLILWHAAVSSPPK